MPATNRDYWTAKIARNVSRDAENLKKLEAEGWKAVVVWECELKPATERLIAQLTPK